MNVNTTHRAVNLETLEHEVTDSLQQFSELSNPSATPDIGKLSADVVLEQYKMAAKAVEAMGEEMQKRIAALDAAIRDCYSDMKLLHEAAAAISDKGKHAHAEIERTSAVSKDIREVISQVMTKLA
jgi:chromosome segregation ATPase